MQRQNPLPDLTPAGKEPEQPTGVSAAAETELRPPRRAAVPGGDGDNRETLSGAGIIAPAPRQRVAAAQPRTWNAGEAPCGAVPVPGRCRPPLSAPKAPAGAPPGGRQEAAGAARPLGLSSLHPSAPDREETSSVGDPPHGRGQPEEAASLRPGLSPPRSARRVSGRR